MISDSTICKYDCPDVNLERIFPGLYPDADKIRIAMISEAPPSDPSDYFYRGTKSSFFQTTRAVFSDAGVVIKSYKDIGELGVYLTTAIKCSKKEYLVSSATIKRCSEILESELNRFINLKVIMCMGDFAIKAINYIYKKNFGSVPIRPGSTYKIRKEVHIMNGIRFFPSYTQTGDSFNIEKSKRKMIAEDIMNALEYVNSF
jgi:uracil-DNA glycosylase